MLNELTDYESTLFLRSALHAFTEKDQTSTRTLFQCARVVLTDANPAYISFCIYSLGNIVYSLSINEIMQAY